jgi:alanine racemase
MEHGPAQPRYRATVAEVDLTALSSNVAALAALARPAQLCAVVKADGYGHGAVRVAQTALRSGASSCAVALVEEAEALRRAGVDAPLLLLSEPPRGAVRRALELGCSVTVYSHAMLGALRDAATELGVVARLQLKLDTGMHRVGAAPEVALELLGVARAAPELMLEACWTHLAVADELEDGYTDIQLDRLERFLEAAAAAGLGRPPLVHAANSAGLLSWPRARLDLVRCGIACYGYDPRRSELGAPAASPAPLELGSEGARPSEPVVALTPVLSLRTEVVHLARRSAGDRPSYGRLRPLERDTTLAVLPIGYADGVPRALFSRGSVLVGGRRCPIAGAVTMDQLIVDCGHDDGRAPVRRGDEAVLIGVQGDERITAQDWASWAGTIPYEICCGVSSRVPRVER